MYKMIRHLKISKFNDEIFLIIYIRDTKPLLKLSYQDTLNGDEFISSFNFIAFIINNDMF